MTHSIIVSLPLSLDLPLANSQEPKELEQEHDDKYRDKRDHCSNSSRLNIGKSALGRGSVRRSGSVVEFTTLPHLSQGRVGVRSHLGSLNLVLARHRVVECGKVGGGNEGQIGTLIFSTSIYT